MSRSPSAEILAIGTELLLGEIADSNSAAIAVKLREIGLDLYRTTAVGDNVDRISRAVRDSLARAPALITTGGLGPTVDDVTREGIAAALDRELEFHQDLWEEIQARFAAFGAPATENNRRQAFLPAGSQPLHNPVGTAPGFLISDEDYLLASLPGVPGEMQFLLEDSVLPAITERYGKTSVIRSRLIRTAGVGESWLDERIGDLEEGLNPTVGLAAHAGRVDIRITAKAGSQDDAEHLIDQLARLVRKRLGDHIYASGESTLEDVILQALRDAGGRLTIVESGTRSELARGLSAGKDVLDKAVLLPGDLPWSRVEAEGEHQSSGSEREMLIAVQLDARRDRRDLNALVRYRGEEKRVLRRFHGRAVGSERWAASMVLEAARRLLTKGSEHH